MSHDLLIADTDPWALGTTIEVAGALGHGVRLVSSVHSAVRSIERAGTGLVLIDAGLNGFDGPSTILELRQHAGSFVPVIVTIPAGAGADRGAFGADDVLAKPLQPAPMAERVTALLQVKDQVDALCARVAALEQQLSREHEMFEFLVHDLRSPAAVLESNLDYALEGMPESEIREALLDAVEASRRVQRYVEDLSATLASERTGMPIDVTSFRVRDMLAEAVAIYLRPAQFSSVTIELLAPPALELTADRKLLARVVENLVDNALRYTERGGRVLVRAWPSAQGTKLVVANTGIAIPPANRPLVFEKYVRKGRAGRTGIGLYFCRRVAEAHGGSVELEELPDFATAIAIDLPRSLGRSDQRR